jgi:hypothetical protein
MNRYGVSGFGASAQVQLSATRLRAVSQRCLLSVQLAAPVVSVGVLLASRQISSASVQIFSANGQAFSQFGVAICIGAASSDSKAAMAACRSAIPDAALVGSIEVLATRLCPHDVAAIAMIASNDRHLIAFMDSPTYEPTASH